MPSGYVVIGADSLEASSRPPKSVDEFDLFFLFFFFFNEINCSSRRAVGSVVRFTPFDAGGFLPGRRVYTGAAPRWAVSF